MLGYKYLNIASGATPIGSADHAPDKKIVLEKEFNKRSTRATNFRVLVWW
jgi:hypothetical protein